MFNGPTQPPVQRGTATAVVDDATVTGQQSPTEAPSRWQRARASTLTLFPNPTGVLTTRRGLMIAFIAVVASTVVSLLRTTGTGPLQSIWEEDARDVLNDAINLPTAKALVKPVAGYYIFFPRLLGELATLFPVSWAAAVLSISAALVVALLVVQVYVASGAHFTNPMARFLVSAPLLAAPAAENVLSEIYNRPVCLHFFAAYALFWLFLWTPSSRWGKAGLLTTVGMTAFSTILIIGYLPLAVVRLYLKRDRLSLGLAVLSFAGAALQAASVLNGVHGRSGNGPKLDPIWAVATYLFWEVPNSVLGFNATKTLTYGYPTTLDAARHQPLLVGVSLAVPIIVLILAFIGARRGLLRPKWLLAGLAAGYSVWMHVFMVSANGAAEMRYVMPIELLLFASLVALLIPARKVDLRSVAGLKPAALMAALGVFLLVVSAFNYRHYDTYRNHAPVWTDQIHLAALNCRHFPNLSTVNVRGGPQPFWSIVGIPCQELLPQIACTWPRCLWLDPPQSLGPLREVTWTSP